MAELSEMVREYGLGSPKAQAMLIGTAKDIMKRIDSHNTSHRLTQHVASPHTTRRNHRYNTLYDHVRHDGFIARSKTMTITSYENGNEEGDFFVFFSPENGLSSTQRG